jgi:hypothetical protein
MTGALEFEAGVTLYHCKRLFIPRTRELLYPILPIDIGAKGTNPIHSQVHAVD